MGARGFSTVRFNKVLGLLLAVLMSAQLLSAAPAAAQPDDPPPPPPSPAETDDGGEAGGPPELPERREIVAKRTENTKFFEEADGTYTAEVYSGPVHFQDGEEKWREIKTELISSAESGWAWKNRGGPFSVSFAERPRGNELVRLHHRGPGLSFGLEGANTSRAPKVDGSTITYPDVHPGVDLTFEVRNSDLKEVLVLKEPPHLPRNDKRRFIFPVRAHGLRAVQEEPGAEILLVDDNGETQFTIPKPWMNDSSVDPHSGEAAFSDDLTLTLVERGRAQFIEMDVPTNWLLDPARVYPVYVDPTVTLTPSKDTFIQSNIVNTPQDGANELKAGTYDGSTVARSLVRFDVSSLRGKNVTGAKLSLYNHWSWSCHPRVVEVYRVTSSWSSNVTWPNRPGFAPTRVDSKEAAHGYDAGCANDRVVFDQVGEPVRYWLNHPEENHGFGIRAANESDVYGWKRFQSFEGIHKPQLIVTYEEPANQAPQVPTDLSPNGGSTGGTQPTLVARYHDPDPGDGGYVKFRVHDQANGNMVASGKGTFAEPGQISRWAVPSGKLEPNKTYYWNARGFDHNLEGPATGNVIYKTGPTNNPPNLPTQLDPHNGARGGENPTFSAYYSDPNGDVGRIRFSVYNTSGQLMGTGQSLEVASGSTASWRYPEVDSDPDEPVLPLVPGASYWWEARAYDATGARSAPTSPPYSYTVESIPQRPPYTPYDLSPANGSCGGAVPTMSATYDDPDIGDGGKVIFKIFQNGWWIAEGHGSQVEPGQTSSWTVPAGVLQMGVTYQWYAVADDGSYQSGQSSTYTYSVCTDSPPYAPTQPDPPNGTISSNKNPTLSAVYNDPDAGDWGWIKFDIYVSDIWGNLSYWDGNWGTSANPGDRSAWQVGRSLEPGKNYVWYAMAYDGDQYGPSMQGQYYSVPVANNPPQRPTGTNLKPPDNTNTNEQTPLFSGYYYDPDPGDYGYLWFEVYEVTAAGNKWVAGGYSPYVPPGSWASWRPSEGLLKPGDYVWRAHAYDETEASLYSEYRSLKIRADQPPNAPSNLSPPDNTASPNKRPTFTATYTDPDGDPGHLLFAVDKPVNGDYWNVAYHDTGLIPSGTTINWTPTQDLAYGIDYKWRVNAWDSVNHRGTYSAYRSYWVDNAPSAPTSLDPPNGTVSSNRSPQLSAIYNDPDPGDTGYITCLVNDTTTVNPETQIVRNSTEVLPGQRATCNIAPRLLTPGRTYSWTAASNDGHLSSNWAPSVTYKVPVPPPGRPAISSSTHPDQNKWYSKGSEPHPATFTWSSPATENVLEYRVALTVQEDHDPSFLSSNSVGTSTTKTYSNVSDRTWWFHVAARNEAGWGQVGHYKIQVDDTAPPKISATSTTHSPPGVAFKSGKIHMKWSPVTDVTSGVAGYRWVFRPEGPNGEKGAPPDAAPQNALETDSADSQTGRYWFHVQAVDRAGNPSEDAVFGPYVVDRRDGTVVPVAPTLGDSMVAHSDENGMEQFYPYRDFDLGTYRAWVNLHSGNLVVRGTDVSLPGKGLNTILRHTYNSHRTDASYHDTGMGPGWSLSLADASAGLDSAADVLQIDLNAPIVAAPADVVGAVTTSGGILELTDGDGTVHRFIRKGAPGTRWESPPGVGLRVKEDVIQEPLGPRTVAYHLIRPDGVRYVVRQPSVIGLTTVDTWHVTKIVDRFGSELSIGYEKAQTGTLPLTELRVKTITDNRRTDPVVELTYSTTGQIESITSLPDSSEHHRTVTFAYSEGRLASATENTQAPAEDQRVTVFSYAPHTRQGLLGPEQVWLLDELRDGMGKRTAFRYDDAVATGAYRLLRLCDRRDNATGAACSEPWRFVYGPIDPNTGDHRTNVFAPVAIAADGSTIESRTAYDIGGRARISDSDRRITGGNIERIEDAGTEDEDGGVTPIVQTLEWTGNLLTARRDGAGATTRLEYNDLGLLTKIDAPPPNASATDGVPDATTERVVTRLVYEGVGTEGAGTDREFRYDYAGCDPSGKPSLYCHTVADMIRSVAAEGHARQRITDFWFEGPEMRKVIVRAAPELVEHDAPADTDKDAVTTVSYHDFGGVASIDGPRRGSVNDVTQYRSYDETGFPKAIEDGLGGIIRATFTPYGKLKTIEDQNDRGETVLDYDVRDNVETVTVPGGFVSRFEYDLNDNRTRSTTPRGSGDGDAFTTIFTYGHNEWLESVSRPGTTSAAGDRLVTTTDFNFDGSRSRRENPAGAVTTFAYHPNRLLKRTERPADAGELAVTTYFYDASGRQRKIVHPSVRAGGDAEARPVEILAYTPNGGVARVERTSPVSARSIVSLAYDPFGDVLQSTGPRANTSGLLEAQRRTYDSFGRVTKMQRRLNASKWLQYGYVYDLAGNLVESTQPTGLESNGTDDVLTTRYAYDDLGRLTRQTDPHNPDRVVTYDYLAAGQQWKRIDNKQDATTGELTRQREVEFRYNDDYTMQAVISTDLTKPGNPTIASCNFAAEATDRRSGYDAEGNLKVSRTVRGSAGCADGETIHVKRFDYDHAARPTQIDQTVSLNGQSVSRTQKLSYRKDSLLTRSEWQGQPTKYEYSAGGFLREVTDWRAGAAASSFRYFPGGTYRSISLGGGAATADFTYHADGSVASMKWFRRGATAAVRSHTGITYDVGGLRREEQVLIAPVPNRTADDTGGAASFRHDLAGRLVEWTSPFELSPEVNGTDSPRTEYELDDGGNIISEKTSVNGAARRTITSTFVRSRLAGRTVRTVNLIDGGIDTTTTQAFTYNALGDEIQRTARTSIVGSPVQPETGRMASSYDPAGRTSTVDTSGVGVPPDVDYVYDGSGQPIARTSGGRTTYFFYFDGGSRLAEETAPSGTSRVLYLNDPSGRPLAEHRFGTQVTGEPNAADAAWVWLLRDPDTNIATEVEETANGTALVAQRAYDPYGSTEPGGSSFASQGEMSRIGYQESMTDEDTGNLLLGPRLYDPSTDRFTTPDSMVAGAANMALGLDPLTGNRYLFAAANPVGFYDDGYSPLIDPQRYDTGAPVTPPQAHWVNGELADACYHPPEWGDCLYHDEFGAMIDNILWAANDIRLGLGAAVETVGEWVSTASAWVAIGSAPIPVVGVPVSAFFGLVSIGASGVAAVGNLLQFEFKEALLNASIGALGGLFRVAGQLANVGKAAVGAIQRGAGRVIDEVGNIIVQILNVNSPDEP